MDKLGIIEKEKTVFVLVDAQEKLVPVMSDAEKIIKNINILVKASKILNVSLIVTEQYPKGLGKTVDKIILPEKKYLIEKMHFSCFGSDEFVKKMKELGSRSIVLFGIEAHVCILKTALDGLKSDFQVHVVADAVSSRTEENKNLAFERMKQSGAFVSSTEMILFQLIDKAGTDEFRELSRLIK